MTKRNYKRWVEVEVHPSAEEVAEIFWEMDTEEQAYFFKHLYEISGGAALSLQMSNLVNSEYNEVNTQLGIDIISQYRSGA